MYMHTYSTQLTVRCPEEHAQRSSATLVPPTATSSLPCAGPWAVACPPVPPFLTTPPAFLEDPPANAFAPASPAPAAALPSLAVAAGGGSRVFPGAAAARPEGAWGMGRAGTRGESVPFGRADDPSGDPPGLPATFPAGLPCGALPNVFLSLCCFAASNCISRSTICPARPRAAWAERASFSARRRTTSLRASVQKRTHSCRSSCRTRGGRLWFRVLG
ncbi:hypothetical protein T484DRAFT_2530447 [Baffinella frigidus]|nr:hypothetical protein T484DRAFT_2530447 [Cryptophyta sp. CCMP2293]